MNDRRTDDMSGHATPRPTGGWRRALYVLGTGVLTVAVVAGFVAGRRELAKEREREAPIAAPTRVRNVPSPAGDEVGVVLDTLTERRIGIQAVALGEASRTVGAIQLTGEVTADPSRVSTIRAAVAGRLEARGGAWPVLGEPLEAGRELAQVSDARPLVVPQTGVVTHVGAQPGEQVQAGQELVQLTDFREPLVRVVWRLDLPLAPPPVLLVTPLGGAASSITARTLLRPRTSTP